MSAWEVLLTGLIVLAVPLIVSLWSPGDVAHDDAIELGGDGDEGEDDGEDGDSR